MNIIYGFNVTYGEDIEVSYHTHKLIIKEEPLQLYSIFDESSKIIESLSSKETAVLYAILILDLYHLNGDRVRIIRQRLDSDNDVLALILSDLDLKYYSISEISDSKLSLISSSWEVDIMYHGKILKSFGDLQDAYKALYEYVYKLAVYTMIKESFGKETDDLSEMYITA